MLSQRFILSIAALFLLSACSGHVDIPSVTIQPQANLIPLKGKYAAMVQTGGWQLETKNSGHTCGAWSFTTEANKAYADAMRDSISQSLETIDFIDEALLPEDVKRKGYAAQIVIYQGNATSSYSVNPGFFTGTAVGNMTLNTNIAVTDTTGLVNQYSVSSSGVGQKEGLIGCEGAGVAISNAGQDAIKNLAQNSVMYIRDGLRDQSDRSKDKKKS